MNLTKNYTEKISVWKNNIPNIDDNDLNTIYKNHKKIYNYIKNTYSNLNTIKTHLVVLAGVIKMLYGDKNKYYKQYSDESTSLAKQVNDAYLDNTHNPKCDIITLTEIETRRNQLLNEFNNDKTNNKLNLMSLL